MSGKGQSRLVANPMIGVGDIQRVFQEFFEIYGSRNLHDFMQQYVKQGCGWKTAPKADVLAALSTLYVMLAKLAPNSVLPILKTQTALEKLHLEKAIHSTTQPVSSWSADIGAVIRCAFGDYRTLKRCQAARARCYQKAHITERRESRASGVSSLTCDPIKKTCLNVMDTL